jgi:TPR repeat protein
MEMTMASLRTNKPRRPWRRALSVLLGMSLLACGVATAAVSEEQVARDWQELLARRNYAEVQETYALATALDGGDAQAFAAACRQQARDLARALKINTVGLALWRHAQKCAAATGESALAEERQARFEALLRYTFAQRAALDETAPLPILEDHDAIAVAEASGQELLYIYYDPYEDGRELRLVLGLWDAQAQRERRLVFDYLRASLTLALNKTGDRDYPVLQQTIVRNWASWGAKNNPGGPLADLQGYFDVLTLPQPTRRRDALQAMAARDSLPAALLLAQTCWQYPKLECGSAAVDALLPYAEKRLAPALAALALVYATGSGVEKDLQRARALLDSADQRLGGRRGRLMFGALAGGSEAARALLPLYEAELRQAARDGDAAAVARLAAVVTGEGQPGLDEELRSQLQRAAEGGLMRAQFVLALDLQQQRKPTVALAWMRRAAESGHVYAQYRLASAYEKGGLGLAPDPAQALAWYKRAALSGSLAAAREVAVHYANAADSDRESLQEAEGWLASPAQARDEDSMMLLAQLYMRDIRGLQHDAAFGLQLATETAQSFNTASARRTLAVLLIQGNKKLRDQARAETLLRGDAEQGDVMSQVMLAGLLLKPAGDRQRMEQSLGWLRKAADSGSEPARGMLANVLWHGMAGAADRKAARELWDALVRSDKVYAVNDLAWALCTSIDEAALDPQAGLVLMRGWQARDPLDLGMRDTLAACLAASGDFSAAVATQRRVVDELPRSYPERRADAQARLNLYKNNKRYSGLPALGF